MSIRSIWLQLPTLFALCGLSPAWAHSCATISGQFGKHQKNLTDPVQATVLWLEKGNSTTKSNGTRTEEDIACLRQKNIDSRIIEAARGGLAAKQPVSEIAVMNNAAKDIAIDQGGSTLSETEKTELKKKSSGKAHVGGDAIILGALDKSLIDAVIKLNMNRLAYCYQRELPKHPELAGKVTLKFVISRTGSVDQSSTYKTTLGNPIAEACMNQQMKMLKFPEPKGGGIVIVKYPFEFST